RRLNDLRVLLRPCGAQSRRTVGQIARVSAWGRAPGDLASVVPILATLLAALPGCNGCHGSKPYTPYSLTDPPASAHPDAGGGPVGGAGGADGGVAFVAVPGAPPPGDGKSWPLEGGAASAPAGHVFAEGLVFDADGDGKPDLVAWSR